MFLKIIVTFIIPYFYGKVTRKGEKVKSRIAEYKMSYLVFLKSTGINVKIIFKNQLLVVKLKILKFNLGFKLYTPTKFGLKSKKLLSIENAYLYGL